MLTLYPMFDDFSEAEAFSKTLLSLGQALWQFNNLPLEEKQQSQIIKYQILGNYATILFTRYEVKTSSKTQPT
mgnify:CR=1 FL=1